MSANEEPTTSAPTEAQNAPDTNDATNEPSDNAATESTSKANEAAADAEASSLPPADAEDKHDTGKETDSDMKAAETAEGAESSATVVAPEDTAKTPAKKDAKRRASSGPGSTKKLKSKKSQATLNLDAKPGDHYWARLKGYPPWPAIICDDDMLPASLHGNRPVTAIKIDGTYREDYADGGKNVRDRTYPVMYLSTNEFSWMPNVDLTPLDPEEVKKAERGKKSASLWGAYELAAENHDLQYYKQVLTDHDKALREEEAELEAQAAEKAAKAAKKNASKKSKAVVSDEDTELADDDAEIEGDEEGAKKAKSSKKRKKDAESEGEASKPAKTPKTKSLKLNTKASNGETETPSGKKSKAKTPKATKESKAAPKEPELTEEEKKDKREKEVLYFRHKLQKGFLTSEAPKDAEMSTMAGYFEQLEALPELEQGIIRTTKIHKVLKAILKLTSIPKDEDYHFKDRSMALLTKWQKVLTDGGEGDGDKTEVAAAAEEKVETPANETPAVEEKKEDVEMAEEVETKDVEDPAADEAPKEEDADKEFVPADEPAKEEGGEEAKAEVTETAAANNML